MKCKEGRLCVSRTKYQGVTVKGVRFKAGCVKRLSVKRVWCKEDEA